MLDDYGITVGQVMRELDRGQSTVWAWLNKGTQDLEVFAELERLAGAPAGEILRRCVRPNGKPYIEPVHFKNAHFEVMPNDSGELVLRPVALDQETLDYINNPNVVINDDVSIEDQIRNDVDLLPHLRGLVIETYKNALRMSEAARSAQDRASISEAS